MSGILPIISPMKNIFVATGKLSNNQVITNENPSTPTAAPIPKKMMNLIFFLIADSFNVSTSTTLSYTPKTTIIVPPLTPGITFATPNTIPYTMLRR